VEAGQAPELLRVQQWRYEQARNAGLTKVEARLFAESDRSLEELRRLVALGCKPQVIAKIVL
jgi:hypothetical protein